ncbi:MAG: hypothetical protein HYR56_05800 [Acidobacteria bacterium]|nr:hypothetical protein [Acidobacteriota bacterium]MBI3424726.1 hypothetical protein [Acidobacteriota bacterium]
MDRPAGKAGLAVPAAHAFNHQGWAWLALAGALTVHVADEALTGFLSVYNPTVLALRERLLYLPLPTFRFEVWLRGLIAGSALLWLAAPAAFAQRRWLTLFSYPFAVLMCGNGLLHIAGTIYQGRRLPGVYSAPLLLAAAGYLLWALRHIERGLH